MFTSRTKAIPIARYERAKKNRDARDIMHIITAGSVWQLRALCKHFGTDPDQPGAMHSPPQNRRLRWKVYAVGVALVLCGLLLVLLGWQSRGGEHQTESDGPGPTPALPFPAAGDTAPDCASDEGEARRVVDTDERRNACAAQRRATEAAAGKLAEVLGESISDDHPSLAPVCRRGFCR